MSTLGRGSRHGSGPPVTEEESQSREVPRKRFKNSMFVMEEPPDLGSRQSGEDDIRSKTIVGIELKRGGQTRLYRRRNQRWRHNRETRKNLQKKKGAEREIKTLMVKGYILIENFC